MAGSVDAEGRYYRTGIGLEKLSETVFTDDDCSDNNFGHLYGCGTGSDGHRTRAVGDFGTTNLLEFGFGNEINPTTRFEFLVEYRPSYTFNGETNYKNQGLRPVNVNLSSISGMFAYYRDFKNPGKEQKIVPFFGAGIGAVHHKMGTMTMMFPGYSTIVPGYKNFDIAWMVTSGIGMPLDENTTLDLAWRYTDLGEAARGKVDGKVVLSSRVIPLPNLKPTYTRIRGHGFRISIRRKF